MRPKLRLESEDRHEGMKKRERQKGWSWGLIGSCGCREKRTVLVVKSQ